MAFLWTDRPAKLSYLGDDAPGVAGMATGRGRDGRLGGAGGPGGMADSTGDAGSIMVFGDRTGGAIASAPAGVAWPRPRT